MVVGEMKDEHKTEAQTKVLAAADVPTGECRARQRNHAVNKADASRQSQSRHDAVYMQSHPESRSTATMMTSRSFAAFSPSIARALPRTSIKRPFSTRSILNMPRTTETASFRVCLLDILWPISS